MQTEERCCLCCGVREGEDHILECYSHAFSTIPQVPANRLVRKPIKNYHRPDCCCVECLPSIPLSPNVQDTRPNDLKPVKEWTKELEDLTVANCPTLFEDDPPVRTFDTGATRDTEAGKFDYEGFLSPLVLERFAAYMHKHRTQSDGSLRDSDNWQRGMPKSAYMKSLWRHFMAVWALYRADHLLGLGERADLEEALCAMLFNVQGYLLEELREKKVEEE